jgi:hypothetical protein
MFYAVIAFAAYVVITVWYIHRLQQQIKSYETTWIRIEDITDHNSDGDIVIHATHVEKE